MFTPASRRRTYDPRDLAAEIVRRAPAGQVIHLSEPPTPLERVQLMAARLLRTPIAIMPHRCKTVDEWTAQYGARGRS